MFSSFFLPLSVIDPNNPSVFDTQRGKQSLALPVSIFLSLSNTHTCTRTHTPLQAERVKLEACLGIFFVNLCVSAVNARLLAEALLCHGNTNF